MSGKRLANAGKDQNLSKITRGIAVVMAKHINLPSSDAAAARALHCSVEQYREAIRELTAQGYDH